MAAATGMAMERKQNRAKKIRSTEVVSIGGYSRVVVTFSDGSKLFAYGSDTQTKVV